LDDSYVESLRSELMAESGNQELPFINYNQLEFLDELGQGASGTVWKGIWRPGEDRGMEVAIKTLITASQNFVIEFKTEILLLHSVKHPNVVTLFGVAFKPILILVMEFCSLRSLHHVMISNFDIGWDKFFQICKQADLGLQALHTHSPKILHRDMKPLNLLITKDWQVKVADFGVSLQEEKAKSDMLKEQRGTSAYMPPELFHSVKYSVKSDIYSLGIIFWEILYRVIYQVHQRPFEEYPYSGPTAELLIIVAVATENLRPTIPPNSPPILRYLVETCTKPQPKDRPECPDVLTLLEKAETNYKENKEEWENIILKKKVEEK